MNISRNVELIRQNIESLATHSEAVNIVAATKYVNANQMEELFESGITMMGENRVDALLEKKAQMTLPIEWLLDS